MIKSEKARGGGHWIDKYMWFIVVLVWISRDDDNDDNVDDDTIGCAEKERKKKKESTC